MTDWLSLALSDLAEAYRERRAKPSEVAEQAIARHDAFGEALGAYIDWAPDFVRDQAVAGDAFLSTGARPGPLFGIPFSVKDLYGLAGFRTRAGTPNPLPAEWEQEGRLVGTARRQLALIMGKTHTVEFAFGGVGYNPHYPVPRNPWDPDVHRVPGGSSSGAGVSLIEGSALIAFGSDTGGSVRIPASITGTVGLKTSTGRWPLGGIVPLSPSLDTAGILTRTVADAAYGFAALDPEWGEPERLFAEMPVLQAPDLTIGLGDEFYWNDCSPGIAEAVRRAIDELTGAGARIVDFPMPETAEAYDIFCAGGPVSPELYTFLVDELPGWLDTLHPIIGRRMGPAGEVPAHVYLHRKNRLRALHQSVSERLRDVDVVVTPTVPLTPPALSELEPIENYPPKNLMILRNTAMGNYLDLCALTLPVGLDAAGMPVGLQLMARHGEEESLLAVGLACERVLGTGRDRIGLAPACS